jgi:2-isopropylmalate synthase
LDALGEVTVRIQDEKSGRVAYGRAANTDVIVASAQAYLNAVNRILSLRESGTPTKDNNYDKYSKAI